jgi:hypothetical protein
MAVAHRLLVRDIAVGAGIGCIRCCGYLRIPA